jgi:hypothetical protein
VALSDRKGKEMNIEEKIEEAKALLADLELIAEMQKAKVARAKCEGDYFVVCTKARGVFCGFCEDPDARPLTLTRSRQVLYWSKGTGGWLGIAESGPADGSRISKELSTSLVLEGVTAVAQCTDDAQRVIREFEDAGSDG